MSLEIFVNAYRTPVLVELPSYDEPPAAEREAAFQTLTISWKQVLQGAADRDLRQAKIMAAAVHPVMKSSRGPYVQRISVGRARNSDISLDQPHISKFHAYFTQEADGDRYFLTDPGSKNGVLINETRLEVNRPYPLGPEERIAFGPYWFLYLSPPAFHEFLLSYAR
ncbi:MAG TPA: FHA domain-containing protein [Myxococcota bacterium]|nr:FHA domain-containing protein [Myxococcota bacterium]